MVRPGLDPEHSTDKKEERLTNDSPLTKRDFANEMEMMMDAKDVVVWIDDQTKQIMVKPFKWGVPEDYPEHRDGHWGDPIGAAYTDWHEITKSRRIQLMLETAIDLCMQGFG